MSHVCQEIAAYTRACERLLSKEGTLNEDERSLLEYYVRELSQELLSGQPTIRVRYKESVAVNPSSTASQRSGF